MSTKSAPRDSTSAAAQPLSSGLVAGQLHAEARLALERRISANSPLRRCFSRRASVISLTVTRAPSSTHSRRYGRLEPFVIGAITTAPGSSSRRAILTDVYGLLNDT